MKVIIKHKNRILLSFLFVCLLISFVSAPSVGTSGMTKGRVEYIPPTYINYTVIATNQSNYWGDHFYTDYDLLVPYTGATTNVDLGDNNFTVNETTFHVDVNNGRVGVGTSTPLAKSHVQDGSLSIGWTPNARTVAIFEGNNANGAIISIIGENGAGDNTGIFFGDVDSETQGQIYYVNDENQLRLLTAGGVLGMAIDGDAGGRVGIGTVAPTELLEVYSNESDSVVKIHSDDGLNNAILYLRSGGSDVKLYAGPDTDSKFYIDVEGKVQALTIMPATGNVGIGTTNPTQKLAIYETTHGSNVAILLSAEDDAGSGRAGSLILDPDLRFIYLQEASGVGNLGIDQYGNVGIGTITPTSSLTINSSNGYGSFEVTNSSGSSRFFVNASNGRIGIGTTTPVTTLDVDGKIGIEGENFASIAGGTNYIWLGDTALRFTKQDASADLMIITSAGNVGIGTTTPTHKLNVNGSVNITGNLTVNTIFARAINISNSSFSFTHNENDSISFSIQNQNESSGATSLIKTLNDVGGIFGIGIASSNYLLGSMLKPNMTALFSRSQGVMAFINSFKQPFVWYNNPSDDDDLNNLVELMRLDGDGLNVTGNITAENVFLPAYVSSHTNNTIPVAGAGIWYNVTFDHGVDEFKKRITHTTNDDTNTTFTIQDNGTYEITYTMSFEDSAASPNAHVVTRVTKNHAELNGFTIEKDSSKQNSDFGLHHSDLVELEANDEIKLSFTSDDITVSLTSHLTYGIHQNTGHLTIKRIA